MPFSSSGVYTPPAGAESAAAGQLIKSSTWNSIFTDISTAITTLAAFGFEANAATLTASTAYTVTSSNNVVWLNRTTSVAATTLSLPAAASRSGLPVFIKDMAGNAGTFAISIVANGSELIEGAGTLVINSNYGGYKLLPLAAGGWLITT